MSLPGSRKPIFNGNEHPYGKEGSVWFVARGRCVDKTNSPNYRKDLTILMGKVAELRSQNLSHAEIPYPF